MENYDYEHENEEYFKKLFKKEKKLKGLSRWLNPDNTITWEPCFVINHNEKSKKFKICWESNNQKIKEVKKI